MAKKIPKQTVQVEEPTSAEDNGTEDTEELESVQSLSREETTGAIYALLFASDKPLGAPRIAEALGDIDHDAVTSLLVELREKINELDVPYDLREIAGGYQLATSTKYAPYIRRLLQIKKKSKLTRAVLETLAIVAYRQPVTRPDVESIRGVSVSYAFIQLQERGLIKSVGVAELPGRPRLYRTTDEFLLRFGLNTLDEMPAMEDLREMV